MSDLSSYLTSRGETQRAFARRAGLDDSTLSRVLAGRIAPSPAVVERIHQATEGEVTANDLYEVWRRARGDSAADAASASAEGGVA